ncbi:hypothetical protein CBM2606_A30488 [Cupriavidus taiwanensis]|nr:hypothetical protein CBM2606_A30488 [Cupriavidus taiwanensis]
MRCRSASGPSPRRSMTPGRMPSISASASSIRRSTRSRPSAVFRSATTERLPRLSTLPSAGAPDSPAAVRSTAMTSAPRSARCIAQNGPGPIPQISTILMPDSMMFPFSEVKPLARVGGRGAGAVRQASQAYWAPASTRPPRIG